MTELPPLPGPDAVNVYWRGDNDSSSWDQWHDASDPMPDKWDSEPPDEVTAYYTAETVQRLMRAYAAEAVRVALGEPVAWLARNRAGHLFIINGNGPHDVFGGFPVYQVKDHA